MTSFVDVPITTDPVQIANTGTDALQSYFVSNGIADWQPNASNLEIIFLRILGQMFSDTAFVASQVPSAIFRKFGTLLFNVPYENAVAATAVTTWNLSDSIGHTIPAGTYLSIGGEGFYTPNDVVVPTGSSTATVVVTAADVGTAYNDLGDPGTLLLDGIDWVLSVNTVGTSSGGVDAESDSDYQDRLAAELTLQAPRPITANDYAVFVRSFVPTPGTDQELVGRSTAIDGFNPGAAAFTVTTVNTSPTVTITGAPGPYAVPAAGATVTGAGIPANTKVASVTDSTHIVMSANATASASGVALTASSTSGNLRTVGVFVTDVDGDALNSHTSQAIQAWLTGGTFEGVTYPGYREMNFVVNVLSPSYSQISIAYTIHALPGYDTTALVASVNSAIGAYIDPASWGSPIPGALSPTWYSSAQGFGTLRINKLMGVIEGVQGVDYVTAGGLAISTSHGSPVATADIVMLGPAPLPRVEYPSWLPNFSYAAQDQVYNAGSTYFSNTGFTSASTFNPSDWTLITSSPAVNTDGIPVSIWGTTV